MRRATFLLAVAGGLPLMAAIDGTVVNRTTGKPAVDVQVTLVAPSQAGMRTLGQTKSDASGKFSFAQEMPKGPALLQAAFEGATYTRMLAPGMPTSGVQLEVYDSTKKDVGKLTQHMILLQPGDTAINVNETLLYRDDTNLTFNDRDNGSIRFYLPLEADGKVRATVAFDTGGMSVPVERPVSKTKQANVYKVDYPIKPGETRVDLTYSVPAGSPAVFEDKLLKSDGKTRLVVPNGVTAKGDHLQELGKEPQTQAMVYDVTGDAFRVELAGTGSINAAADSSEDGQPSITQGPPHVYNHIYWILALAFGILGLGTYLLLNHQTPATSEKK